jgi:NTE family protein
MAARPRIGLALGSGGARGWCHLGALAALEDMGIRPDVVAGCSMGALVGAAEAGGKRAELQDWALDLTQTKFLGLVDLQLSAGGLVAGKQIANVLGQWGLDCAISDLALPFTAVATNLETGREVWLQHGRLLPAVRASLSIPGVFTPSYLDGRWLVDGGLTNPVPVSVCRAAGADVVLSINPNGKAEGRVWQPSEELGVIEQLHQQLSESLPEGWLPKPPPRGPVPPQGFDVVSSSLDMLTDYLRRTRMAADPADVALDICLPDLTVLEFFRAEESINAGRAAIEAQAEQIARVCKI